MQLWTSSVDYIKGEFIEPSTLWNLCVKSANLLSFFGMFTACIHREDWRQICHSITHYCTPVYVYMNLLFAWMGPFQVSPRERVAG